MAHLQLRPCGQKQRKRIINVQRAGMQERHAAELWRYTDKEQRQKSIGVATGMNARGL